MNNKKIYFKIFTIGVICLAIVLIKILFPSPISKNNMEKEFFKNRNIIFDVMNYLQSQEYTRIHITSTDNKGEMFASTKNDEMGKFVRISNVYISDSIATLFKKHNYEVIIKKNNSIYFQRWSNMDYGRGVVYSIDGELPQNELITRLEPLTEENWYFYEEK